MAGVIFLYGRQVNESNSTTKSRDQIASVIKSAGCSDSRRFNSRPGRTVLPGLFALPIVDGLGDHPGSHDVPVTSMARTCSGSQAMARFNDSRYHRLLADHYPNGVTAEFLC